MKKHNHYEQNSVWAKFGKKVICITDVMQKLEKIICIQIATLFHETKLTSHFHESSKTKFHAVKNPRTFPC